MNENHFLLEVEFPNTIQVPQGTRPVWAMPKKGWSYIHHGNELVRAHIDLNCYFVCFIPKHQWPAGFSGVAISRNFNCYVLHFDKPEFSNGCWKSVKYEKIELYCYEDGFLPKLEIGKCFFRPEVS